jgi:hypothetical protein
MNLDLTAALARALPPPTLPVRARELPGTGRLKAAAPPRVGPRAMVAGAAAKPVLQLNHVPLPLDPANYQNPYSNTNPDGDQRTLYAFRALVDPVPEFARAYRPSARSTERIYQNLVRGASIDIGQDFTSAVFESARRTFQETALETLVITPGTWHPVWATPSNWYDPTQLDRFQPIELDLRDGHGGDGRFLVLGGKEQLRWRLGDPQRPQLTKQPDRATRPRSLRFRGLQVTLGRPWLDFELFGLHGWYLQGQPKAYYSSGETATNQGVLPLVPTSLLLGTDIRLEGSVGADDLDLVRHAANTRTPLSLGPFSMGAVTLAGDQVQGAPASASDDPPALFLIGWCSELVPLAPASAQA